MSKHTPGPWTDVSVDGSYWGVYSSSGDVVAQAQQIRPMKDDPTQIERHANARLIAAAPELLEALEAAYYNEGGYQAWKEQARAAIRKATGEKQ